MKTFFLICIKVASLIIIIKQKQKTGLQNLKHLYFIYPFAFISQSHHPVVEAWLGVNCIFPGTEETMGCFTSSLMAAQSQEASLQRIDWPSQIRAELHEPINGSDSSGRVGNLRSNHIACFRPPIPPSSAFPGVFTPFSAPVSLHCQRPWDNGYE